MLALVTEEIPALSNVVSLPATSGARGLTSLALAGVGIVGRRAPRVGSSLLLWLCIRLV